MTTRKGSRKTKVAADRKTAPFVPKITDELKSDLAKVEDLGGRPLTYDPKVHPPMAKALAKAGLSQSLIARCMGIAPSTLYAWKALFPEFSESLEQGKELVDAALEMTAVQRALGYSYETQKAFQTGVVVTITETLPPSERMLEWTLERRMPERYGERKAIDVNLKTDDAFLRALENMNEQAIIERAARAKLVNPPRVIEHQPALAAPILARELPQSGSGPV